MNRGADRRNVFFDDSDRIEFGARLADIYERFGVETHAYCLMDNHYHTLFHCPDGGLSLAMQRLGSLYTRHVNDRLGRDGALFRGRFHSRVITSEAHLVAAARYIHRNPLDLPGIDQPDGYRWSSHRTYLGFREPPPWMVTSTVLGAFDGDAVAFDRFVADQSHAAELATPTIAMIRAVVETAELVLAEKGLDDRGRIGPLARSLALACRCHQRAAARSVQHWHPTGVTDGGVAGPSEGQQRSGVDRRNSNRVEPYFAGGLTKGV